MHRLVRIEGIYDFKVGNTLKFVLYDGSKYITLNGRIAESPYIIFKQDHTDSVNKLFGGFGCADHAAVMTYCKKHDPYCSYGTFPVHSSLEALKKTLLSFFNLNQDIKIPPKYSIGDKVVIRSKYHSDSNSDDYPGLFTEKMIKLGGETVTISSVNFTTSSKYSKHYHEPYFYRVKENDWNWASEMFEDGIVDSKIQIREIKKYDSETFTVTFTDNSTRSLTVQGSGFLNGHNQIFRTCGKRKVNLSNFLNEELDCVKNTEGYEPYINRKENIWIFIDDLKYRFGTEECKKTINPEFYKHLKKKPKQGIIEQIEYSQTKTQGNAYQFCKRRSTVCRGNVPEGRTVQGKRSKASVSSRSLAYRAVIGQ